LLCCLFSSFFQLLLFNFFLCCFVSIVFAYQVFHILPHLSFFTFQNTFPISISFLFVFCLSVYFQSFSFKSIIYLLFTKYILSFQFHFFHFMTYLYSSNYFLIIFFKIQSFIYHQFFFSFVCCSFWVWLFATRIWWINRHCQITTTNYDR